MSKNDSTIQFINYDDISTFPSPGMSFPTDFKFSPDDKYIIYSYDPEGGINKQLWVLNTKTNDKKLLYKPIGLQSEENLSLKEKLRRERQRTMALGVMGYEWADEINHLFLIDSSGLFTVDMTKESYEPKKIIDFSQKNITDPQISPNGQWIGYVYQRELFLTSFDGSITKQLTFVAKEKDVTNGEAEFIAQEEMRREHGFWWSPDSQKIAFTQVDEKHIPLLRIIHQGKDKITEEDQDVYHYPFAGEKNAIVKLAVIDITNPKPTWMDLGEDEDIYLARVNWLSNSMLTAQIENREQSELKLVKFTIECGTVTEILKETSDKWFNLNNLLRVLKSNDHSQHFIWASERTGYMHLYLYDFDGNQLRTLTSGDYLIEDIVGIDENLEKVYVISTERSPLERHLYAISMVDGKQELITKENGTYSISMNHTCSQYVQSFNSLEKPTGIVLKTISGKNSPKEIFTSNDPRIEKFDLKQPEIISIKTLDGITLYGAVYKPDERYKAPYPTVVCMYGGPGPQMVSNSWHMTANLRIRNLTNNGFLVFWLDNRGSGHRGLAFEGVLKGQFGRTEVQDQVLGVEWLIQQGLADKNRVGITGWSYGGHMSLMCLAKAPQIFKAAVAGAPVNDQADYDTYYSEKYLGKPQDNKEGFAKTCVTNNLEKLSGKLMIIHGLIDENVHFRHTAKIIKALTNAKKDYTLVLIPEGRHSIRKKEDRVYIEKKLFEFFKENL